MKSIFRASGGLGRNRNRLFFALRTVQVPAQGGLSMLAIASARVCWGTAGEVAA